MSTKKIKMQPKPKAYTRRFVGLRVLGGGGKSSQPMAYAMYEESYTDGTFRSVKGYSVYTMPGFDILNPKGRTKKQRVSDQMEYRPDLEVLIQAAAVLNDAIATACLNLDDQRGIGEFSFRVSEPG